MKNPYRESHLDKALRELLFELEREGTVLSVSVQSYHSVTTLA